MRISQFLWQRLCNSKWTINFSCKSTLRTLKSSFKTFFHSLLKILITTIFSMSGPDLMVNQGRVLRTVVPGNRSVEEIYEHEAHQIVDEAIENALHRLRANSKLENQDLPAEEEPVVDPETGFVIPNVKWMSAENFSVAGGLEKIEEFIKTWERDSSWLHCIDFLREEDHPYSYRYRYAVRWSIPTRRKPIPRATASVYFTVEVSKFKPKTFPVEVYFVVETHRLVNRPGKTRFREKWLKDVIQSKIGLMEFVTF